jgi:hypothetical protein
VAESLLQLYATLFSLSSHKSFSSIKTTVQCPLRLSMYKIFSTLFPSNSSLNPLVHLHCFVSPYHKCSCVVFIHFHIRGSVLRLILLAMSMDSAPCGGATVPSERQFGAGDTSTSNGSKLSRNGVQLHPQPTTDPLDPLNWSNLRKYTILAIVMWL